MSPKNEAPRRFDIIFERIQFLREELRRLNNEENLLLQRIEEVRRESVVVVARIFAMQQLNNRNGLEELQLRAGELRRMVDDFRNEVHNLRERTEECTRELQNLEMERFNIR